MIRQAYDASVPPTQAYPHADAAFGYLGGNTPHVWTAREWNAALHDGTRYLRSAGIWVLDFNGNPISQGKQAATLAKELGFAAHMPERRIIWIDSETSTTTGPIIDCADAIHEAGYLPGDYRSLDAILKNPTGLLEWIAHWNAAPGPFSDQAIAFQYADDVPFLTTAVDLSAFDDKCYAHLGRGPRTVA